MRPDDREIDEEIRGHLALSIKERIEQGEDPGTARRSALQEFGYVPEVRDSMRRVWYSRWFDAVVNLAQEMRIGLRSLLRTKGMAATVVVTLALGIGANAAIFSVVRGVLLRPLVNRDEDRLLYIRQSAPGVGVENTTFSVPEIDDFKSRVTTIAAFGDFSTTELALLGFGEPRILKAGVVNGSYFEVMGLRPAIGRLLNASDDGPKAAAAVVFTHRFWSTALGADRSIVGREIRLGSSAATVVGVLEPSIPYPDDTEIIGNMVISPHHLGAQMNTERTHRMSELFGRLAPGATLETARAELTSVHADMMRSNAGAYSSRANVQLRVTPLRDQLAAPARTILLVLLGAAAIVFVIACSNVANLILARSVRREGELAVRAALGASPGALRRTLLAESLVLCCAGAALGVLLARPLVYVVSQFAARFSVRALEVTVDASLLWVGAGLALSAAVLLAYVPRLPASGIGVAAGSIRITPATNRRLRAFATVQIAFSFVLLAGAGTLLAALVTLQTGQTGYDIRQVLAIVVPTVSTGVGGGAALVNFVDEATQQIRALPGVEGVAAGILVPWRDSGSGFRFRFAVEGYTPPNGEENPHGRFRIVSPGFFGVLGVPFVAGRDFTDGDGPDSERVVIVSQTIAQRLFPTGDALNRKLTLEPPTGKPTARRIVGVVSDVDDESVVRGAAPVIYTPVQQMGYASRLFVRASGDLDELGPAVTKIIRELSPNQPVERIATLEDVRAEVLAPDRLRAFVLAGFAGVALLIAVVGVAGVLAFSVSARTHEFGIRLAIGLAPRKLLLNILSEGTFIVAIGILAGIVFGYAFAGIAANYVGAVPLPGAVPIMGAVLILGAAAVLAALMPAARASRVDVLQALRTE